MAGLQTASQSFSAAFLKSNSISCQGVQAEGAVQCPTSNFHPAEVKLSVSAEPEQQTMQEGLSDTLDSSKPEGCIQMKYYLKYFPFVENGYQTNLAFQEMIARDLAQKAISKLLGAGQAQPVEEHFGSDFCISARSTKFP